MLWQVENVDQLTEEERHALDLASTSPSIHFLGFVKIENKFKELVRPDFINALQMKMFQVYEICQHLQLPCHMIVLKSRQSGGSTCAGHITYHHMRRYSARGACIADIFPNSSNIFAIYNRYGDTDEFPWSSSFVHNSEAARFSNRSMMDMLTAENPNAGISGTRQVIWKSEVAKWASEGVKDARKTNSNLMASLNKFGPNSLEIEESTPEGASGLFYEHWHGSEKQPGAVTLDEFLEGKRGNGMIKVFAAWHEHEEHAFDGRRGRPQLTEGEARDILATLSEREKRGIQLYGWSPEQIAWRRSVMATDCGGDETLFDMHYPEDDVSCFVSSGRPRFNITGMANVKLLADTVRDRFGVLTKQDSYDGNNVVFHELSASDDWWFQMSDEPRAGMRYLITVDPMTGAENTRGGDPDHHAVLVYRAPYQEISEEDGRVKRYPMKRVARIKYGCRFDNDRLVNCISLASWFYGGGNGCMVVVEKNKGELIIKDLRELGIPLYRFEAVDKLTGKVQNYYGWETNEQSRHRACERLAALVRDTTLENPQIIVDRSTYSEMLTFIVDAKGKAKGRSGCHDDDVLATMIAAETIDSATLLAEVYRARRGPADRNAWRPV